MAQQESESEGSQGFREQKEIPVNQEAIDALMRGELSGGEEDFCFYLIRRCRKWRVAFDTALSAKLKEQQRR